jgi:ABC-type iron transport system FetAB ATPase subunit
MTNDQPHVQASPLLRIRALQCPHADPFSLDVGAGECIAILGPSGAGKSVLLRMIADLDPNTGEVWLNGRLRETWAAPEWRRKVVYQSAEPAWWESTAGAHFPNGAPRDMTASLDALGLTPAALGADLPRLSTGERQRLALLRSLACHPKVLLLDEPTASLDQASTSAVEALLRARLEDGVAILLVTHSHEQADRIATRHFRVQDREPVAR